MPMQVLRSKKRDLGSFLVIKCNSGKLSCFPVMGGFRVGHVNAKATDGNVKTSDKPAETKQNTGGTLSNPRIKRTCYRCRKEGHNVADCPDAAAPATFIGRTRRGRKGAPLYAVYGKEPKIDFKAPAVPEESARKSIMREFDIKERVLGEDEAPTNLPMYLISS